MYKHDIFTLLHISKRKDECHLIIVIVTINTREDQYILCINNEIAILSTNCQMAI